MIRRWTLSLQANDGILNALLTALNERRYTNEGYTVDIPVISFFAASNEIPNFSDPAESILRPLYDRFELKVVTKYVEDKQARLDMLAKIQRPSPAPGAGAVITLEELYAMQAEVRAVRVPDSVNELMDDLLCQLRKDNIHVSDRKFFGFAPLAQARAWLCGRDEVRPGDLGVLRAYLWTSPEEMEKVWNTVTEMIENPLGDRIRDIHSAAAEAFDEFKQDVGHNAARAMVKLRTGFIALYKEIAALDAQSERDKEAVSGLIESVEEMNRGACDLSRLTYTPVAELAALDN